MALDFSYLQSAGDTANGSSYTFSSQNLGTADAARYIIVGIGARWGAAPTSVTSVTVGGVSATEVVQLGPAGNVAAIYIAAVPTGTTGDVVVTLSDTMLRCVIHLYRVVNIASATASDTDSNAAATPTMSIDVPAGGFAVGVCMGGTTGSFVWSGLTEDDDRQVEAATFGAASDEFVSAQTGLAVSVTVTGATTDPLAVVASWDDAASGGGGNPWYYYAQMAG